MTRFSTSPLLGGQQYPALTGLRGLATLLVLCFHYFDGLLVFRPGWLGVDLLFVLCGFLITGRLLETRSQPHSAVLFLKNRFLRIVPVYVMLLTVYFWLLPSISHHLFAQQARQNAVHSGWYFSFLQNWLYVTDGYPAIPALAFLWSLAIQVQYYLLQAFLVHFIQNIRSIKIVLYALAVIAFSLRMSIRFEHTAEDFPLFLYNTLTRLDSFCAGALVYIHLREYGFRKKQSFRWLTLVSAALLAILSIAAGTTDFRDLLNSTFGVALFALLASGVIYNSLLPGRLQKLMSHPWLCFAGRISYGLYLYHVLVMALLSGYATDFISRIIGTHLLSETLAAVICMAISIMAAWFSHRFIEHYFLRFKTDTTKAGVYA
jgi:peptidoglycan/LPS O-acetylase OafA/YrhL